MLHLGLRKPRANDLEMQVIENTADPSFHSAFPPALPRSLPASGHSILQVTRVSRAGGVRQNCCPATPPAGGTPPAIQTSFGRLAIRRLPQEARAT